MRGDFPAVAVPAGLDLVGATPGAAVAPGPVIVSTRGPRFTIGPKFAVTGLACWHAFLWAAARNPRTAPCPEPAAARSHAASSS